MAVFPTLRACWITAGCLLSVSQPPFALGDTGTVGDIELHGTENARPGAHQPASALLGRTYRRHIAEGVHMSVNVLSAKKNDAKAVRRSDPLALDPEAHETKVMGQAQAYEVPPLVFDEDNPVATVTDPETGTWASISFRLSLIPRAVAVLSNTSTAICPCPKNLNWALGTMGGGSRSCVKGESWPTAEPLAST